MVVPSVPEQKQEGHFLSTTFLCNPLLLRSPGSVSVLINKGGLPFAQRGDRCQLQLMLPSTPFDRCNESAGHGQMMDVETSYSDFINCDRTGRRNAVPDISGEDKAVGSTSELSKDMAEMDLKAGGQ